MSIVPNYRIYCTTEKIYVYTFSINAPTICPSDGGAIDPSRTFTWINTDDNISATSAPLETDDISKGYSARSVWVDVVTDTTYICVDSNLGSAIWVKNSKDQEHMGLTGLQSDDHLQYAHLIGRTGGQILQGGTDPMDGLSLESTSDDVKGIVTILDPLEVNNIDTRSNDTLFLGTSNANKVEIADVGIFTEIQGIASINGPIDSTYALTLNNATGCENGLKIKAGEKLGDIALRIEDADASFNILEIEADGGYVTLGKSYADVSATNGIVYGMDNQHDSANASHFNTRLGTYRIAGDPLSLDHLNDVSITSGPTGIANAGAYLQHNGINWINRGPSRFDAYYDQSPDIIVSLTQTNLPLNVNRIIDTDYSHTPGSHQVTINTAGNYHITAKVSIIATAGGTGGAARSVSQMRILLNGLAIPGTLGGLYHRGQGVADNTATVSLILALVPSDIISIQAVKLLGGATLRYLSQGCSLTIINI